MEIRAQALEPGEPPPAARPADSLWKAAGYRLLLDRVSRRLVTLGGILIIASILAILFVIVAQVLPLFERPRATPVAGTQLPLDSSPLAVGIDEYREIAFLVTAVGIHFVGVRDGQPVASALQPNLGSAKVVAVSPLGSGPFLLGLSDGRALPVAVRFKIDTRGGSRIVSPVPVFGDAFSVAPDSRPIRHIAYATPKEGPITAAAIAPRGIVLVTVKETKPLVGPATKEESRQALALPLDGEISVLALDNRGEDLFVGTSGGQLTRVDLRDPSAPKLSPPVLVGSRPGASITALRFLLGDRSLVVGDSAGGVGLWRAVQMEGGNQRLERIHAFEGHPGPVVAIESSPRDKAFLTADGSGLLRLHYGTSGKTLLSVKAGRSGNQVAAFSPKSDGLVLLDDGGRLSQWELKIGHPQVTLGTLFGKIWYEGYPRPEYVWQSSGATDDVEPKFSLVPLIYGTLKGTFYALLIAVPIAILAALYASQFMHPTLKGVVKPTVEIMAALPSVVLGFLGGLWLAPHVERVVPGLFLMAVIVPAIILMAVFAWHRVPVGFRRHFMHGTEVGLLVPIVVLGVWLSFQLGGVVEHSLLSGDYRTWLHSALGLTYDQRNSLVVGVAMGFAVIPIIFTIAEDSLSNVPQHLVAGSLALGATRWHTALRVVLPTASPGIFSAIMIGFGRAVGETMIVLMATGNTPIMNWNMFSGFRALSANIAVELPEAPVGGTLFRVLFLAALLLYLMTFVVNTVAELVRLRLRRKFRYL